MGAHDYIVTYETEDQKKIKKLWAQLVEEDGDESGTGSYAGNATTMHGPIRFHNLRCSSKREASDLVLEKHDKWDGPVAVSYYIAAAPGKRDTARAEKAMVKLSASRDKHHALVLKILLAFRERKSKLTACKGCGSRLAHEHLVKSLMLGRARNEYYGAEAGKAPICPVCCTENLLSETEQKRIIASAAKVISLETDWKKTKRTKPGKKLGWCVGGWAAS